MQSYAAGFLIAALSSACFVDSGLKKSVSRLGKLSLGVFTALFVVTEAIALLG
jgi:hypothetical protein